MTVANGRYALQALLHGEPLEGLWSATSTNDETVWVTLRRLRASADRTRILSFSAFGIDPPLYIGSPDIEEEHRDYYFCVVDRAPRGTALARVGKLQPHEAARLGVSLCDVVATWAASSDGMIFSGLHPETIFLDEQRGFSCALPRPHFLLGLQSDFYGYPNISFDPPGYGGSLIEARDAVFTIGLLVWWATCGVQPYYIPGTDRDANAFDDRRLPFDGPDALGQVLDQSLKADPDARIQLVDLRRALVEVAR
jgi:hypothetical protein